MVYNGRKRYYGYSRAGRRGSRALSTRYIFNNKSARSQANTLNAMRKRINFVYRQCRPEVKTIESNPVTLTLAHSTPNNLPSHLYQFTMPELGVEDNARIGNSCNILDAHLFMSMRIGYQGDVSYQLNGLGQTVNTTIRVIPFMVKAATDVQPDPTDILPITASNVNGPMYRMNSVAPFNEGVSSKYQILGDYKYTLRLDDKSTINTKLRIKGNRIKKYIDTQYNTVGKATIYVLVTWNGLEPIQFQGETIATPAAYITLQDKTAYTDP